MRAPHLFRSVLGLALASAASACSGAGTPAAAPAPAREVGAFVVRLGADTVAVEEFARSADRIEGRQVVRTPRTSIRDFSGSLRPDGSMERFEIAFRNEPGGPATAEATIDFRADTAVVRIVRDGAEETHRIVAPAGSIPAVGYSVALYEIAFSSLRAAGSDTLVAHLIPIGGAQPMPLRLERRGMDTILVHNIAGENRVRVDADGRLLFWDGRGSTLDLAADRNVSLDIDRFAREFRERDAAGRGLGALSPRDSVVSRVGAATVSVAYGQPSARGREIFGGVVPWGEVWRTGANLPTILRTDRDLVIGGAAVPAGAYSLFTIPAPGGWQLVVNRRSEGWGTQHDPAHDLARVPMQRQTLDSRVEQLTISVVELADGVGELRIAWDDTRAAVPVRAR